MKKTVSLAIAVLVIGTAAPSHAISLAHSMKSQAFDSVQSSNFHFIPASKKKPSVSDLKVEKTTGAQVAAPANASGNGPWVVRTVLRTSPDGESFSGGETIMDQAGVPNLLVTSSGDTYAYYQDWANGNVMGVAII